MNNGGTEKCILLSNPQMDQTCYARTSCNHADRLIPGVQLTYAVLSTSPWRGLSALELLDRSQLQL